MTKEVFTRESRWQAVAMRDKAADGFFYYAVKTTGIYCRPGCASRTPKRENVAFFGTCAAAETAGYRACKRCNPAGDPPSQQLTHLITQACQQIEQAESEPTLAQLAQSAHLSKWHFQRLFKQTVGITPKQYAKAHRQQRLRNTLKTSPTITDAIYEAGFNSSSRAYQKEILAMTPTTYRNGAVGLPIRYTVSPCALGQVIVGLTGRGVCAIAFGDDEASLVAELKASFPKAALEQADEALGSFVQAVVGLIDEPTKSHDLPLDIRGTAFQEQVWQALRGIPAGTTIGYAELAQRIGRPKASRAVAQACGANKIALAIPCHRVVRSDDSLGGYRWGIERKETLLARELAVGG